jgi:cytochrome c-type biogenesis protein CcmH
MFWILAAAMLLGALAFVLVPLLRARGGAGEAARKRDALELARRAGVLDEAEFAAKLEQLGSDAPSVAGPPRALSLALGALIALGAVLLYRGIGEPRALDPVWQGAVAAAAGTAPVQADGAAAPDMEQAVSGLAERLKNDPDDLEGWMLLGRAYKSLERFGPAREAMANAYRLAPENPEVMIDFAEAQVLASDSRRFEGEPLAMLQRALALEPHHPRGLWLSGIAAYQDGNFLEATSIWEHLLAEMPPEAEARAALTERIAETRQRAGLGPMPPSGAAASATTPTAAPSVPAPATGAPATPGDGPRLTVSVDIAPELKARIAPSDVLFVFARAAEGPRMPLAIQRLPAGSLPVTVTLDDSTSMMPTLKLSTMPQVVVGARISKTGQATPQPGDFEVLSAPVANTHSAPIVLVIDKVVP